MQLLLDRYGPLVWSIARRQVGAQAAEDVVQEAFVQVWKSAAKYDPAISSEATYITTIARRRIIDHRRRLGRGPEREELLDLAGAEDGGIELVDACDEARIAAEALSQLKPDQQRVLRLGIVEGLTHREIADQTGIPLGTVKSHARRGLERVRSLLQARGLRGRPVP